MHLQEGMASLPYPLNEQDIMAEWVWQGCHTLLQIAAHILIMNIYLLWFFGAVVNDILYCFIASSDGLRDGCDVLREEVSRRKLLVMNVFVAKVMDVTDKSKKKTK